MSENYTSDDYEETASDVLNYIADDILSQRRHHYRQSAHDDADAILGIIENANDSLDETQTLIEQNQYKDAESASRTLERHLDRLTERDLSLDADRYKDRLIDLRVALDMLDALS